MSSRARNFCKSGNPWRNCTDSELAIIVLSSRESATNAQSTLNLTGGTLNLGVNIGPPTPGLAAQLYSTGSGAAQLAFGGPQYPGNTYATYVNYFAGITPAAVTSTGAGGVTELSFVNDSNFTWTGSGPTDVTTPYGNIRMYETIAPTYTRNDEIVSRFKGKIVITAPGAYTFATNADDGSMLYIDGGTVVSNNASQGHTRRTGTVALAPGLHDIDIGYYEGGGLNGIIVDYNGPDTGGVATTVPNSVLLPLGSAPTAFLNPVTVTGNSIINAGNGASVASLSLSVTKVVNVNGYQLDMGPLTLTGGAGLYTINVNTQYAEVCARSISDGGVDADLVNNGPGMLILESGASPQLQNPGSSVTSAALGIVLGGAGGSPTGNATVNVNGGSLVLSSKGGDQSYSPVGISFTNGGNIAAGKICEGIAGTVGTPIRTTLTPALTVNNTKTLSLSTRDNYILKVGAISGGGSVSIPAGTVETSGAVTLTGTGQFTVANSKVSTLAGVSAGAITVTDSTLTNTGTLTSASSLTITNSTVTTGAGATAASIAVNSSKLISTGAIATGAGGITLTGASSTLATLELHGGSISGGAITGQGASVHVTSGVTTATTSANFTGFNPTGLKGRFIVTGGGGQISRGDTQSGILTIETGTNGLVEKVLNQPLNFPQDSDGPISVFFNGANTGPGFAMGFFGNFTAPTTGLYTLQTGLNDDDAGFWVDLDGDGVFEGGNVGGTPGANGNELIAWASCCGDGANQHPGTVMLTQGNLYKVGIAVEDGQGGSGLVGRITAPGGSIMIVDPSSAAQPGWWTYGQPNQLTVDAGAELKIPKIDGSVSVLVNGKLEINGASSTFDSLSIGSGGIVTLGAGGPAPGELAGAALAVPEPGSVSLMLLGVLGCLGRRERVSRD